MHLLTLIGVGGKGDNGAIARRGKHKPRFLKDLADRAVVGAFALLKVTANAEPFALIDIVFLFYAVKHQILPVFFQVTKRCVLHFQPFM